MYVKYCINKYECILNSTTLQSLNPQLIIVLVIIMAHILINVYLSAKAFLKHPTHNKNWIKHEVIVTLTFGHQNLSSTSQSPNRQLWQKCGINVLVMDS